MRSPSIVGAAVAALGLTGMPSPAMASDGCERCVMPAAPLRDGETERNTSSASTHTVCHGAMKYN